MYDFTEKKFLQLPLERQHKKCAELIRHLYEGILTQQDIQSDAALYHQLSVWMQEPPLSIVSLQTLADRYHWHLQRAKVSKKEHHLLPSVRQGDRLQSEETWPIAIYLDHLRSAHNVGSILRTVEALALGTVYFSESTPFIDHKQVQDTSMGAYQWVSCQKGVPLFTLANPIIALETSENAIPLYEFIFPDVFTLVVGNEEYGCSENTLAQADYVLEIPLRGRKNSLNVANAFAMVASEIQRQKGTKKKILL